MPGEIREADIRDNVKLVKFLLYVKKDIICDNTVVTNKLAQSSVYNFKSKNTRRTSLLSGSLCKRKLFGAGAVPSD